MDTTPRLDSNQLQSFAADEWWEAIRTLDDVDLESLCPLDNGRHVVRPRESLGQLDKLPIEIIIPMLLSLDIHSLIAFRRVNSRAMDLVNSLHEYQMISKHCINILRAIICLGATWFNWRVLYETLSTTKCEMCPRYGSYLYLITCERVCYLCFTSNVRYLPLSEKNAISYIGSEVGRIPHVLNLWRWDDGVPYARERWVLLFDRQSISDSLSTLRRSTSRERLWESEHVPNYGLIGVNRYMTIISAPYFIPSSQSAHRGFYCTRCTDETSTGMYPGTKYTEDEFPNHIRMHGLI
ncbi:hypothetical protein F5Y04DRAFT_238613 [Hypomontagnella monticulosa]|nr:hypothetical protein F5Y04DRAFT_238613 [Hypomontagnella monticulosa]